MAEKLEGEKKLTKEARKQAEEERERQRVQLEREQMEKEEQRRKEAKGIFAEKIRLRLTQPSKDFTWVPCPGGDVSTTRPDLILCGPGNKVTIEKGGHVNGCMLDWDRSRLEGINLCISEGIDWVIEDFSKFDYKSLCIFAWPEPWSRPPGTRPRLCSAVLGTSNTKLPVK